MMWGAKHMGKHVDGVFSMIKATLDFTLCPTKRAKKDQPEQGVADGQLFIRWMALFSIDERFIKNRGRRSYGDRSASIRGT